MLDQLYLFGLFLLYEAKNSQEKNVSKSGKVCSFFIDYGKKWLYNGFDRREDMKDMSEKPTLILQKKVEKVSSRLVMPKAFVKKHGVYYYMEVYEDKIILKPIKKEI